MPQEAKELVLGGQAVIEGVMMKGPKTFSVAVRRMNGEIRVRDFAIAEGSPLRARLSKMPLVRGVVTMAAMLVIGYKALQFSADEAIEDAEAQEAAEKGLPAPGAGRKEREGGEKWAMAAAMGGALAAGIGLFFLLPHFLTVLMQKTWPALSGSLAFNLIDGVVRVLVFVAYVVGISFMKDIRRIFQYHGAEHKVVNAYEAKAELAPESVAPFPVLHPRCGTSFLLFVMVIGIVVFSFIPYGSSQLVKVAMKLALLPAVAGISYEVLRLTARKLDSPLFRAVVAPGMLLQRLTTREPDLAQIEVALASFRRVLPSRDAGEKEAEEAALVEQA
jgi:uncharacterized protein YqhQ